MPPGKSWNCVCKISRTWKVLENEFGPGKSWNLLGNDVDTDAKMSSVSPLFHILQNGRCQHCIYSGLQRRATRINRPTAVILRHIPSNK